MASANKSTGLQIALVLTVMSTIIAIVVAFLQYRSAVDAEARLKTANDERQVLQTKSESAAANLKAIKTFVGFPEVDEVGKPEVDDDKSVIGMLKKAIAQVAPGDLAQPTVSATLHRLGEKVDSLTKNESAAVAKATQLNERVLALQGEYQKLVDAETKARADAEKDRNEAQSSKEQAVVAKDKQIGEHQTKIQELQAQLQTSNADLVKLTEESKNRIGALARINDSLRRQKDEFEKKSFEVADGVVEWVDRDTDLVWINRGEADALRQGTTFSVYKQGHSGVGRGAQDIKGAIEVSQVIGPHQSQARITRSQNSDPIIPGDPIYTPLWHAGRKENFAFVGLIDLDGDGVSDRDILHDLVSGANAVIVDEVDDKGVRHPENGSINVGTKFLVVGRIPDYTESRPEEHEAHQRIGQLHEKMVKEAQEHGVRVVALHDFLSYIGYVPSRRIWRPGQAGKWNLRQGAHSSGTKSRGIAMPESTGTTSRRYSGNPNLKPPESTGQNSKVFKK